MTNETVQAATGVTDTLCQGFNEQLTQGQELWQQALQWLTDKGLTFAINLISAIVILVLGALAIKLIVSAVGKAVEKGKVKNSLLSNFVRNATSKVCWAVLIVVILGKLGVNVGPIVAGLGVTGFILGFAFQESLGNLASGLMIAINSPFKVGDYVIVAGLEGTVFEVNMMATVLVTADNKKVVIPNKSAWGAPITNFSAMSTRRVDLKVGISYGCDMAKAIKVVLDTVKTVPGVLEEPAPSVSIASLDDSEVTLNVRPWCKGSDYWGVWSATYQAVLAGLEKAGLDVPYPQLDVHVTQAGN